MLTSKPFPKLTPEEAVAHVLNGTTVAVSGFGSVGAPKAIPRALAAVARTHHVKGEPFEVRLLTGAGTGIAVDEPLAQARAISWRAPYQNAATLRKQINRQEVEYLDLLLSHVPQTVSSGFLGKVDLAVIEATEITPDGRVFLTTSVGASPTYLKCADRVLIEVNHYHSRRLREMTDIITLSPPPHRNPLPALDPMTKFGWSYAVVDPKKVIGVVETDGPDYLDPVPPPDAVSDRIADHVIRFLFDEMHAGRIPEAFLPVQTGGGSVADGVLAALGKNPYIPPFKIFNLVIHDPMIELMEQGKVVGASATSLSISAEALNRVYSHMDFFVPRIVLRPQEISNSPAVIRRLGVIALNAAIEVDIYGNANASHLYGTDILNGVGGSSEFTRNSFLPIIMCPSIAKGGRISGVVPMCPHIDNNEHSVQIIVTDQGLADLRGLGPRQRAETIISNCAHPAYRDYLRSYLEGSRVGHIRHNLREAFRLHRNLIEYGAMLPELDLTELGTA